MTTGRSWRGISRRRRTGLALGALALVGALGQPRSLRAQVTLGEPPPATAQVIGTDNDPPGLDCLAQVRGTLSATPQAVYAGQAATLHWSVQAPSSCSAMRVTLDGVTVPRSGTKAVSGLDTDSAVFDTHLRTRYALRAVYGSASPELASTVVEVYLPVVANRPTVRITANHQASLLVLALRTPRADIFVENHVAVDLTDRTPVVIAEGVHLRGGRTAREPGGLLFMRPAQFSCDFGGIPDCERPGKQVFLEMRDDGGTNGDNVRISGLRLSGGEMGSAWNVAPLVHGILIHSRRNVEIVNNEIFGWQGSAVRVQDDSPNGGRICHDVDPTCTSPNPRTIRIQHNYIHHNQHDGGDGYGVDMMHGAYALIEKNVFDYNRHAIAGGGQPGTGYLAYRNLVLEHGGFHDSYGPYDHYTHQFDMHGTATCFPGHFNCGDAGEYMDIRFNSFFYTRGPAFELRGKPAVETDLVSNVFAHLVPGWALEGHTQHIRQVDNVYATDERGNYGRCDFDGDGLDDLFLATGQTWWFNSGGDRHWTYLNTSTKRLSELTLGEVDGDARCDVVADGVVVSGGTGKVNQHLADIRWKLGTGQIASWTMDGSQVAFETRPGSISADWQLTGAGDFSGDGYDDVLWRDGTGRLVLWEMARGNKMADAYSSRTFEGWTAQGSGDFDGDGVKEILWRDASGQLGLWLEGEPAASTGTPRPHAPAYPGYDNVPQPVDLAWTVAGVGDFDGDGRADVLWWNPKGLAWFWFMDGAQRIGERVRAGLASSAIMAVADFDNDGRADLLWRDGFGALSTWFGGDDTRVAGNGTVDVSWRLAEASDFDRDGRADLLWLDAYGRLVLWRMTGRGVMQEYLQPPPRGWQLTDTIERTRETDLERELDEELPVDRRPSRRGL